MAHKKGGGSTRNGRDSNAQRLGVKVFDGEWVHSGSIIVRQRGSHIRAGTNVKIAKDDSLFAIADGLVKFGFASKGKRQVSILPQSAELKGSTT
ncbi:MAG: 50S ribosomal protein L27 [Chloroflexi bacterium]|nr:50S ribosomal protein L27 [Chloroflexota bacterium]